MGYSDEDLFRIVSNVKKEMGKNCTKKEFIKTYKKFRPYPCFQTFYNHFGSIKNMLQRTLDWEKEQLGIGIMTTGVYKSEGGRARLQIISRGTYFEINVYTSKGGCRFKIPRQEI